MFVLKFPHRSHACYHPAMPATLPLRPPHAALILRSALAVVFLSHGLARAILDRVEPFGVFLDAEGFPAGIAWAWAVTLLEIVGGALLLGGRLVRTVSALLAVEMLAGIWLVHLRHGWFVVGHGQNGAEYAFVLVASLLALIALVGDGRRA